jgi:hypothetical protein
MKKRKKSINEKKIREIGKKEQGIPKTCKIFEGLEKNQLERDSEEYEENKEEEDSR